MKINSEQEMIDFGRRLGEQLSGTVATTKERAPRQVARPGGLPRSSQEQSSERMPREGQGVTGPADSPVVASRTNTSSTANKIGAKVIELLGDVGAGKTTFTRGLAKGLGIKEPVTSPSFTIMKSYASPTGKTLVHYDFYRLPDPGLMADDLADSLNNSNNIVVVEWADTVESILPDDRIIIKITYNDDGTRELELN